MVPEGSSIALFTMTREEVLGWLVIYYHRSGGSGTPEQAEKADYTLRLESAKKRKGRVEVGCSSCVGVLAFWDHEAGAWYWGLSGV